MSTFHFPWTKKVRLKHEIFPIFIPFAGCERRCIFCAQDVQSGKRTKPSQNISVIHCLNEARYNLFERQKYNKSLVELAFYGGTFTALSDNDFSLCLDFAQEMQSLGISSGARCSTRPDTIIGKYAPRLIRLFQAGFQTIELGVQSFDDGALAKAKRHYTNRTVEDAVANIKVQGFSLGIQLMPGMPGVTEEIFAHDVHKAIKLKANCLRFYPCQVIKGTELEQLWIQGQFAVWTLETCIEALSKAWLAAQLAEIPVIRMGLAPEKSLESQIVAGPWHEALGNMVQAQALYMYVQSFIKNGQQIKKLTLPNFCQGYFWGHKHAQKSAWEQLGIHMHNISWHEFEYIEIELGKN